MIPVRVYRSSKTMGEKRGVRVSFEPRTGRVSPRQLQNWNLSVSDHSSEFVHVHSFDETERDRGIGNGHLVAGKET